MARLSSIGEAIDPSIREQLTAPKARMFAQALRQWACLFPQRSDVDAAQGVRHDGDGISLSQGPSFIHAGRLEGVLEPDPESPDGEYPPEYRFKMLARSRRNAGVFSPAFMQMVAMHQ